MIYSPCGRFELFYDDYDPAPTFYSSVNTGLRIRADKCHDIVDFGQHSWNATLPPVFPGTAMVIVEVRFAGGMNFALAIDLEQRRYCFRPFTGPRPFPHFATDAPDWRSGLTDIEQTMYEAARI